MKIIALHGPANSGKTYTINVAYHLLLNEGYVQIPGHFNQDDIYNFLGEKVYGSSDFTDILIHNEKKIGITTGFRNELAATLHSFQKAGCAVAICACHDSEESLDIIKSYQDHTIIEKTPQSEVQLKRINDFTFAKKLVALV
jgi:hypothetical protein